MRRKILIACLCLVLLLGAGLFRQNRDSDIWIVRYQTRYHADTLGFGLTEWEEDYFVAHDYTCSGRRIKERPEYVQVDGVWYQYVSERIVPRSTTWDDVESFIHQKGGIGFQTCYKDRYLVTHYEPAE